MTDNECPDSDPPRAPGLANRPDSARSASNIHGTGSRRERSLARPTSRRRPFPYRDYLATALTVMLCGLVGLISHMLRLDDANIVMILLAGVVFVAARYGRGPAIVAAVFGVLLFDFFFVPPIFSFAPSDAQYFITLGVLLSIGLLISTLTSRLQTSFSLRNSKSTARLNSIA